MVNIRGKSSSYQRGKENIPRKCAIKIEPMTVTGQVGQSRGKGGGRRGSKLRLGRVRERWRGRSRRSNKQKRKGSGATISGKSEGSRGTVLPLRFIMCQSCAEVVEGRERQRFRVLPSRTLSYCTR